MNKIISGFCHLFFIFLLSSSLLFAQSKQELEKKKKLLLKDIEQTTNILKATQKNRQLTLNQVVALSKQIIAREKLIGTISSEIRMLDSEIDDTNQDIEYLKAELIQLKKEYAAMILFAFRNQGAYNKMMFIFAAENFNQAYKRLKYLQQFSEYRQKQAQYIEDAQVKLSEKMSDLEKSKKVKNGLLAEEQKEKVVLGREKELQQKNANVLQVKEQKLKKDIQAKQAQARKLDQAIQAIIKKEIEAARKKAEALARAKGEKPPTVAKGSSSNLALTPEAQKLSADFTGNKGKLPWPVEKGVIIEYFGTHEHPTIKGVTIQNLGVDIKTPPGAAARAIFAGEVSRVISIPGSNNAILINHGEYYTVYQNLKSVSVKAGQKVTTKQALGTISTEDDETTMELQIWKGMTKLDPVLWLAK
jgi:murein hydrolase activator